MHLFSLVKTGPRGTLGGGMGTLEVLALAVSLWPVTGPSEQGSFPSWAGWIQASLGPKAGAVSSPP